MQSIITRRTASAFRASPIGLRPTFKQTIRTYADEAGSGSSSSTSKPPMKSGSALPFIAVGGFVLGLFSIYVSSSSKEAGSGQAEIKEARREKGGAHGEYHDARDSGVKTLEQKRARDEGKK